MRRSHLKSRSGIVPAFSALAVLFVLVFSAGCTKKAESDSKARQDFLAPTDVNKLTPEARAHLPGSEKFQPTAAPKKP